MVRSDQHVIYKLMAGGLHSFTLKNCVYLNIHMDSLCA